MKAYSSIKPMKQREAPAAPPPEKYIDTIVTDSRKTRDELRDHQTAQLKKIVSWAYESVPFYKKKYDECGIHPCDINSLDDITKLPIICKADLKGLPESDLIPEGRSPKEFMLLRTAGSTGEPLTIYRDNRSINRIRDYNMWIFYRWCDGTPLSSVLYIMTVSSTSLERMLLSRFPVEEDRIMDVMLPTHVHFQYLQRYVPQYLSTYPSVIRNLSIELLRRKKKAEFVKLIHSTAELLDEPTKDMARTAFPNARIVQSYGSHEGGLMAFQCPLHDYMHICSNSIYLEVKEDETVQGSTHAIITDFTNYATPIIRYAGMGDLIQISDETCSCGIGYPLITKLEGRIIDSIILPDGTGISPFTVTLILKEIRGIHKFQIIQNEFSSIEIHVVPVSKNTKERKELEIQIIQGLKKTIARGLEFKINWVTEIQARKPGSHKVPVVICNLKTEEILRAAKKDEDDID